MLVAAILCAVVGFGLLVLIVMNPSDTLAGLLIAIAAAGLGLFLADFKQKHPSNSGDSDEVSLTDRVVDGTDYGGN